MQESGVYIPLAGWAIFHLLVFPGGLFALGAGLILKGADRKLEARLQRRVGPPLYQPFLDLIKLSGKEAMIPASAQRFLFRIAPLLGFAGMAVCAALLPVPGVYAGLPDMGDMLVYFYLLPLPAVALILAGSSSSSPFGALGFSREMTIMFAYEIPLLLVILAVALHVGGGRGAEFSLGRIVEHQLEHGQLGFNWELIPAFLAYLFFLPGTMGVPPFDIPEAETEIIEGPLLEYSGAALAFFQMTGAIKTVVALGFGVALFFPGTLPGGPLVNTLWFLGKCLALMFLTLTLVKAATGRFRVDQAFAFYLRYPTALAALSLILVWARL
ncbi:MAG: NADH-quinone oxidoreductase subunit H [Desulfovibrionaceae bacterium]|nr:NADH-quinone oxidoreductase subunit H [Desulfovibrionaceae bacterium]